MATDPKIAAAGASRIIDSRHSTFYSDRSDWEEWRLTMRGGDDYINRYLVQYPGESNGDFKIRKRLTPPTPAAKAAIRQIRNALFSRLKDVSRNGGSKQYQDVCNGLNGGVNRQGRAMNAFIGLDVLEELLVMGKCGITVENSADVSPTLAMQVTSPYFVMYQIEDVLSYSFSGPDDTSQFKSVLLRDNCIEVESVTGLPLLKFIRFRLFWKEAGAVYHQYFNAKGEKVDIHGHPTTEPIKLDLTRVPFVMPSLGDSLLRDASGIQRVMLNNFSRAVNYDRLSNAAILTLQESKNGASAYLKKAGPEGEATAGSQEGSERVIQIGSGHGILYGKDTNAPSFIGPDPAPFEASLKLKDILEADIHKSINLAVQTLASRESAESKSLDNQGLEDGLAFIGSVLCDNERMLQSHFAAYENVIEAQQQIATISYPDRYSLKTDRDRIEEAKELSELLYKCPSQLGKRKLYKQIISALFGGRLSVNEIREIHAEIDQAAYLTSDPDTIIAAFEQGIVDVETAAQAIGFIKGIGTKAQEEKMKRIEQMAEVQGTNQALNNNQPPTERGNDKDTRTGTEE